MNIALLLKKFVKIPAFLGNALSIIPYNLRPGIGNTYKRRKTELEKYDNYNIEEKKAFIYDRMKRLVEFSYRHIDFYKEFYRSKNFSPDMLNSFEDINKIPIIRKNDLLNYNIENRSYNISNRYLVNTGGTSGMPLKFYILPDSMGHEWAHMHTIWKILRFKQSDLRLTFGGRSDIKNFIEYDSVRHQYNIDIYKDFSTRINQILKLFKKNNVKYLHGYPSAIYEFALFIDKKPELKKILRKKVQGVFLGSEFPHSYYRDIIEKVFDAKTISWYGHTERSVLAYEKQEQFKYFPFQTYGYSEVCKNDKNEYELISTSYYNFASPLIRYNTEDIVEEPFWSGDILEYFKIKKGRSGEYVLDLNKVKISLTGLIFGRHHKLFEYSNQIQVSQSEPGKITVLYCSKEIEEKNAHKYFDTRNVNLDFKFKRIDNPIMTISGKVKLLVGSELS